MLKFKVFLVVAHRGRRLPRVDIATCSIGSFASSIFLARRLERRLQANYYLAQITDTLSILILTVMLFRHANYDKDEEPLPYDHKATSHQGSAVNPDRSFNSTYYVIGCLIVNF